MARTQRLGDPDAWHEALFPAAVAAFDWAQDRRHLAQFGYFGHLLDSAIDERALFDSEAAAVRSVQNRIAMLLRRDKQADRRNWPSTSPCRNTILRPIRGRATTRSPSRSSSTPTAR
ncbi:hypothetical protein ASF77_12240 [Massilia sp. Leaf139]|nr:hypothetical protein ASF77_12240 [Massilia sp. Leaf139]